MDKFSVNHAVETPDSAGQVKGVGFERYQEPHYEWFGQLEPSQRPANPSNSGKLKTFQVSKCLNYSTAFCNSIASLCSSSARERLFLVGNPLYRDQLVCNSFETILPTLFFKNLWNLRKVYWNALITNFLLRNRKHCPVAGSFSDRSFFVIGLMH